MRESRRLDLLDEIGLHLKQKLHGVKRVERNRGAVHVPALISDLTFRGETLTDIMTPEVEIEPERLDFAYQTLLKDRFEKGRHEPDVPPKMLRFIHMHLERFIVMMAKQDGWTYHSGERSLYVENGEVAMGIIDGKVAGEGPYKSCHQGINWGAVIRPLALYPRNKAVLSAYYSLEDEYDKALLGALYFSADKGVARRYFEGPPPISEDVQREALRILTKEPYPLRGLHTLLVPKYVRNRVFLRTFDMPDMWKEHYTEKYLERIYMRLKKLEVVV